MVSAFWWHGILRDLGYNNPDCSEQAIQCLLAQIVGFLRIPDDCRTRTGACRVQPAHN
jgi:hypothetical protein